MKSVSARFLPCTVMHLLESNAKNHTFSSQVLAESFFQLQKVLYMKNAESKSTEVFLLRMLSRNHGFLHCDCKFCSYGST